MKGRSILLALSFLLYPLAAFPQHSSKAAESRQADPRVSQKATLIAGQLSLDGKSLISENNDVWTVANPEVLAGYQGRQISLKCQVLAGKKEIHVFSVEPGLRNVKLASNRGDSAFRR